MAFREAVDTPEAEKDGDAEGEPELDAPPLPLASGVLLLKKEKLLSGESVASPEPVGVEVGLSECVALLVEVAVPCDEAEGRAEGDAGAENEVFAVAVDMDEKLAFAL